MKQTDVKRKFPENRNIGRFILIIALCVLFAAVYFGVLRAEQARGASDSVIMRVYAYADAALFIAFVIINVGFSTKLPTRDMFDPSVSDAEAEAVISRLKKRKAAARNLLYLIIPLTFSLFADIIILFWSDFFASLFKGLASSFGI